jgi:hypothetical protein
MSIHAQMLPGVIHEINLGNAQVPPGVIQEITIGPNGSIQTTHRGYGIPLQVLSSEDLAEHLEKQSVGIFNHYYLIQSTLKRYEGLIRSRWAKKTRAQRQKMLEDAWVDDMPKSHRPDLQYVRKFGTDRGQEDTSEEEEFAYIWPHINLEDLLIPSTIPQLLNSRGRNPPCAFAAADWDSTELGRMAWSVRVIQVEEACMVDLDGDSPTTYGRLRPAETEEIPNAANGWMVLRIQNVLMDFLFNLCQAILHDKELDLESLNAIPEEPEPPEALVRRERDRLSAVDMARESPYITPQSPDLERIQSLINARLREWEDYAWALREDPSFFADVVGDWSEHSSEQIPRRNRKVHPNLANPQRKQLLWDRSISSAINEVYENLIVWRLVDKELEAIITYREIQKNGKHARPDDVLGYVDAVERLKCLLDVRVIEKLQRELSFLLPSSPPFRSMFVSDEDRLDLRSGMPKNDYLLWLGQTLWDKDVDLPKDVVAMELNRVVQQDQSQKHRVTHMVARFFADLGLAYELRSRLRMLCPRPFDPLFQGSTSQMEKIHFWTKNPEILALYDLKMIVMIAHAGDKFLRLGDLGDPTRLPYPVNKKRTKDNVEVMQTTERSLDALWERYDSHLKKHLKPAVNALLQSAMPSRGDLQRTKDWSEAEAPTPKTTRITAQSEYVPLSDSGEQSGTVTLPIRKEKLKTKGTSNIDAPVTDATPILPEPRTCQAPMRFTLSRKPYHTFSTLFYQPSTSAQPGEVAWSDFLSAMSAIGFLPEKLYGSVWRFTPKSDSVLGTEMPINFHEPHPAPKLAFRTARLYGRRLQRNYGLDRECFVLGG